MGQSKTWYAVELEKIVFIPRSTLTRILDWLVWLIFFAGGRAEHELWLWMTFLSSSTLHLRQ
jgi:hypothetical protein